MSASSIPQSPEFSFPAGQQFSISAYPQLNELISATYGGDGVASIALPDMRGLIAIGAGPGNGLTFRSLGTTILDGFNFCISFK